MSKNSDIPLIAVSHSDDSKVVTTIDHTHRMLVADNYTTISINVLDTNTNYHPCGDTSLSHNVHDGNAKAPHNGV